MKITFEMIMTSFYTKNRDKVRSVVPEFTSFVFPKSLEAIRGSLITGIHLLPKLTKNCTENYLYITDTYDFQKLQQIPENIPIVCFDKIENLKENTFSKNNIIYLDVDLDFEEAFNSLQECFKEFVDWGKQLDFAVFKGASFQELLDIAECMLDAMVLIYDPALKLLAYSKKYENLNNKFFQKAKKSGYMELDTFKYFEETHAFEDLNISSTHSGSLDAYRDHEDKIKTISINNELAVYCVLLYTSNYPKTHVNALYQVLCDTIYNLLTKQHSTFVKDRSVTDYFLMDLLDNPDTPVKQIKERLYYNDLDFDGNYVLMSIHSDIQKKSSEKYFIQLLRNNLINCRIFSYKQTIVILYHLPQSEQLRYKEYIIGQMQPLLENTINNNVRVFVSRPFTNIGHFAAAYKQAENIPIILQRYYKSKELSYVKYQWGKKDGVNAHTDGYYFFEHYSLSDLFLQNESKHPLFNYCEPFLQELVAMETKKSRQLLEILYEYLKNDRKLTVVAEKLDMHRNNVLYHVQQISENYQVDLDDYETRLKLLLSFEMLKLGGNIPF